jgi:hypothetical protein
VITCSVYDSAASPLANWAPGQFRSVLLVMFDLTTKQSS